MVHRLAIPNEPRNGIGMAPMTVSLRYRCACGNQELLTIQVVLPFNCDEAIFRETMKALWLDMQTEVNQHIRVQA